MEWNRMPTSDQPNVGPNPAREKTQSSSVCGVEGFLTWLQIQSVKPWVFMVKKYFLRYKSISTKQIRK